LKPVSGHEVETNVVKILLIVNPSASGVTARGRVMIQNALAAEHDLTVTETKRRGHATRVAQGASSQGIDLVVSLGGDGTVNEVANGLARSTTALGVLPGGSTNVFSRTLGFVNEPVEATAQLLEAIGRTSIRRIGLGNVNGRFFLFHVGMGYDAAVVEQVEKRGNLKRWLGHPLFMYAAIDTWVRHFDRKHPPFRVEFDAPVGAGGIASFEDDSLPYAASSSQKKFGAGIDGYFAIAQNTDPYTYLGSRALSLAPEASLDDPLTLVTLKRLNLLGTLTAITAALRGGDRLRNHRNVDVRTELTSFTVRAHRPFPWQVDGDHLGDAEVLEFRWEPEVLSLVVR
jgi:diacylglycerol kinase family enzyme